MISPVKLPCYCASLRQAARAITQFYDKALQPAGIKVTQFTVLEALALHPGLSTGELATSLVMDQSTVTRTLVLIEKAGLITTEATRDKREKRWIHTTAGRLKHREAHGLWKGAQERVRHVFGDQPIKQLHQLSFSLADRLAA